MLAFAAEHRFVLADQLAHLLVISRDAAGARMRALRTAGYLSDSQPLREEPPLYQVTTAALRAIRSDLSRPRRVDLSTYRHDAGLAWLAVAAERGMFGPLTEIVSERRMRSEDRRGEERAEPPGRHAQGRCERRQVQAGMPVEAEQHPCRAGIKVDRRGLASAVYTRTRSSFRASTDRARRTSSAESRASGTALGTRTWDGSGVLAALRRGTSFSSQVRAKATAAMGTAMRNTVCREAAKAWM